MKFAKRGLIIIVLILVLCNFVYAATSIKTNLTANKVGPNSTFEGYVDLNFTDSKPLDSILEFNAGNLKYNILLERIFNVSNLWVDSNLELAEATYTNSSMGSDASVPVNFASAGSKTEVGIDLRGPTRQRQQSEVTIENISFNIAPTGSPKDLSISIGSERIYRFAGTPGEFSSLNTSHLGSATPSGGKDMTADSVLCQLINVQDSKQYKIEIKEKKLTNDLVGINATIVSDNPLGGAPDCSNPETPCCAMKDFGAVDSQTYNHAECIINKTIPGKRDEYLCIYITNATDTEQRYFSIGTTSTEPVNGFANGNPYGSNFYIYGAYRTYNRDVSASEVKLDPDSISLINSYIHGELDCTENCLLIPFNTSLGSGGIVTFSNLVVLYDMSNTGSERLNDFRKIKYSPRSARYNGTIHIELFNLDEVISPDKKADYKFFVKFGDKESNKVDFKVVQAPKAYIRYGPFNPGINELIRFDASGSTPVSGRAITSYNWTFGDGAIASGVNVTHFYNETGTYLVILKVTDNSSIGSMDRISISVKNATSGDFSSTLNQTSNSITSFRTFLDTSQSQVKDTATILGISQLLSGIEANLSIIRTNYNSINSNSSLTESEKNILIAPLSQQVRSLSGKLPLRIKVDSSSFSGKITGLNQIYSCCEFTTEVQKTKLLTSQQSITVNAEARIVNIVYSDGRTESFTLIKKDIIGTGAKVYEFMPSGLSISPSNVLVGGNVTVAGVNIYSFPTTSQLIYKIDSTELGKALQIRTAVLPLNLESIVVNVSAGAQANTHIERAESICGNNICENDEDSSTCAKDCTKGGTIYIILIILLILGTGVYFGFFFNGGLLKKAFNSISSGNKHAFKNEKDHNMIKSFVTSALAKGLDETKIKIALKGKGWREDQVDEVLKEIKDSKKEQHPMNKPYVRRF